MPWPSSRAPSTTSACTPTRQTRWSSRAFPRVAAAYGPYRQSQREAIYHSYARRLLREGKAYVDFATKEQLADITARQQAAKVAPGYYAGWSLWRNAEVDTVLAELDKGTPYVVRFRAPDLRPGPGRGTTTSSAAIWSTRPTTTTWSS